MDIVKRIIKTEKAVNKEVQQRIDENKELYTEEELRELVPKWRDQAFRDAMDDLAKVVNK